jgi:hypothetical protein
LRQFVAVPFGGRLPFPNVLDLYGFCSRTRVRHAVTTAASLRILGHRAEHNDCEPCFQP